MEGEKMVLTEAPERYPRLYHHSTDVGTSFMVEPLHQCHEVTWCVELSEEPSPSFRRIFHAWTVGKTELVEDLRHIVGHRPVAVIWRHVVGVRMSHFPL